VNADQHYAAEDAVRAAAGEAFGDWLNERMGTGPDAAAEAETGPRAPRPNATQGAVTQVDYTPGPGEAVADMLGRLIDDGTGYMPGGASTEDVGRYAGGRTKDGQRVPGHS
jgi:hypothetical protein